MFYGKDCGVKIVETFHSNRKNQRRCSHKKNKISENRAEK